MRVEFREIDFAAERQYRGTDRAEAGVAACSAHDGLEQAVGRFQKAIGLAGLRPGDDALEVVSDHLDDLLHWLDLGAHDLGAPLPKHGGDDVDLFAIEDLEQLFAIDPGLGGALRDELGEQRVEFGARGCAETPVVARQCLAQPLHDRAGSSATGAESRPVPGKRRRVHGAYRS